MNPEDLISSAKTQQAHAKEELDDGESAEEARKDVERKREELLLLASDGEIKKTEAQVRKANAKSILKMYAEYEAEVREKSTIFLCDMALSKFAAMMGGLDAVEKPEVLEKELKRDPYLNRDLKRLVSHLTPIIPLLGFLSGGLTVGTHMYSHTKHDKKDFEKEV